MLPYFFGAKEVVRSLDFSLALLELGREVKRL